jgi:pSer/pThr/pTyr-binding forkhead associated (FHA) protein
MQAVDAHATVPTTAMPSTTDLEIVLAPLTRPELGEIRIEGGPFAVGRSEPPFAAYDDEILVMLSRRHARLFCEHGGVYLADQGSRNGTTRNRERIGLEPCRLSDGDEVGFGGVLSFRVRISPRAGAPGRGAEVSTLTLTPAAEDSALAPIVVARFPFLVGKSDAVFARCREQQPAQLGFLSRRHAHIFSRDGGAWIEDLGSTNGTFVDGLRLQERAVPLEDGMLLAFGGDHFTYRVSLGKQAACVAAPTTAPVVSDKTTFVAAPTSFLEIFCADDQPLPDTDVQAAAAPVAPLQAAARRRPRGRITLLWSELASLAVLGLGLDDGDNKRRAWRASVLVLALLAGGTALYLHGAQQRALEDAIARGDHAQAAALADRALEDSPDDVELKAIATQAALEANVPAWLAAVKARDFDAARAVLAAMAPLAERNPDLQPMLGEMQWLGDLERLVAERGGADAPIRIYADEERIAALVERWNDNTGERQRTLARIASHVPPFAAALADALTHLRKLQSDAMVYLPAIERLKTAVAAELERDSALSIGALLDAFATKYPGVGGLDVLRQDLARYLELGTQARAPRSGRLFAALQQARFATPPFQGAFRTLAAQRQLPPPQLVEQYALATQAWQAGRSSEALAALRALATGPWAQTIGGELERRQVVLAQYAALQASRESIGYGEQLLAFRAALDADEDVFFARATQADLALHKDKALARAGDAMIKARALWQEYLSGGPIEARQRAESAISAPFRARARLLAQARALAQQATQTTTQLGTTVPPSWRAVADEIDSEAVQQRNALQELRNVLDPALLKDKLALLEQVKP